MNCPALSLYCLVRRLSPLVLASLLLSACSLPDFKRDSPAPRTVGSAEGTAPPSAASPVNIARGEASIAAGMAKLASRKAQTLSSADMGYYVDVLLANLRMQLPADAPAPQREQNDLRLLLPGHITFASGSASLSASAQATLERVAGVLGEYSKTQVVVEGHSDNQGAPRYNQVLSQQRALSVARFLAARGVAVERLVAVGYGAARPLGENDTEAGRRSNRRVELLIRPVAAPGG